MDIFIPISLTVNGREVNAEVESRTLLVEFLRETLGLTGTHVGCDTSQCGACVILSNGISIKSCSILAIQAANCNITTIEGLANDGQLNAMQEAFRRNHALQCGYCTSGIIMSAMDLIRRIPNPSDEEIRRWLEGHICRCTGYINIIKAIRDGARASNR